MSNHKHDGEAAHWIARWVRQPEAFALTAIILGLALLWVSFALPVSFTAVSVAFGGAVSLVAGTLTGLIMIAGRLIGLHARSQRVVVDGRKSILLPGPAPVPAAPVAEAAAPEDEAEAQVEEPASAGAAAPRPTPASRPEEDTIVLPDARRPAGTQPSAPVTAGAAVR